MTSEESILDVAFKAGENMLIHAEGNPAQVVAVGAAAAVVVLVVGIGCGAYCGGEKLVGWIFDK